MKCKVWIHIVGITVLTLGVMYLTENKNQLKMKMPNCINKMMNNN